MSSEQYTYPEISVCKRAGKFAIGCFDSHTCVRDFIEYNDEATGISEAKAYFADHTNIEPEIVRPIITSMRMTYTKRKRKK